MLYFNGQNIMIIQLYWTKNVIDWTNAFYHLTENNSDYVAPAGSIKRRVLVRVIGVSKP